MIASQVIIQYLAAAGICHVFGSPRDPSVEFLEAARREGMSFVLGSRQGTAGRIRRLRGKQAAAQGRVGQMASARAGRAMPRQRSILRRRPNLV